mgnify:CR=1 FL=1|jgi:hypothetical protein
MDSFVLGMLVNIKKLTMQHFSLISMNILVVYVDSFLAITGA